MDRISVAEMDRQTLEGIRDVAERLVSRVDAIVDPNTRDRYEDAILSLTLVCKETGEE